MADIGRHPIRGREEYSWTGELGILDSSWADLEQGMAARSSSDPSLIELRVEGERLASLDHSDEMFAIAVADVDLTAHQETVARRVFTEMRGRAVLADEAGLGKTIEAGVVVKELLLRGRAQRVLVLCPAALRDQWRAELHDKFGEAFAVVTSSADGFESDRLIVSTSFATQPDNMTALLERGWDVVVFDEAHKTIKDASAQQLYKSLASSARYVLFLTASPIRNDLYDLYHLLHAVNPATFASRSEFARAIGNAGKTPPCPANLRGIIDRSLVRTTRAQAGRDRVHRLPLARPVEMSTGERALHDLCLKAIGILASSAHDKARAGHLAHRLAVSPYALGLTAMRMAESVKSPRAKVLLRRIHKLSGEVKSNSRQRVALKQIDEWVRDDGAVVVFTEHADTVKDLLRLLELSGIKARGLHATMSAQARADSIRQFTAGEVPVLVSTDTAAEGVDLEQRCYCVINYDLPLSPVKIEERIGHIDRPTQPKNAVLVANLFTLDTAEERVYRLLHDKLRLFELRSGQITTVLGELDDAATDVTVEQAILAAVLKGSAEEQDQAFAELGLHFQLARERARLHIDAEPAWSAWLAPDATEITAPRERKRRRDTTTNAIESAAQRERRRQRDVASWAVRLLDAIGADVSQQEHDGDDVMFVHAALPVELRAQLGGRTVLDLAFARSARRLHPDAELCAAGSPVFDALLDFARARASVVVTEPPYPAIGAESPMRAAPGFVLQRRWLMRDEGHTGEVVAKVVEQGEARREAIVAIPIGRDGAPRGGQFASPRIILSELRGDVTEALTRWLKERAVNDEMVRAAHYADRDQYWREQTTLVDQAIRDLRKEDTQRESLGIVRERLLEARRVELESLAKTPPQEVCAEMLTLTLHGVNSFHVFEQWTDPHGASWTVSYPWRGSDAESTLSSWTELRNIDELVVCAAGHTVDATEAVHCTGCDQYRCVACEVGTELAPCPLCTHAVCGVCRTDEFGVCHRCALVKRAPDLDDRGWIGWRTASGVAIAVGARGAMLQRPDAEPLFAVPADDFGDPKRVAMWSVADSCGLPIDSGFRSTVADDHAPPAIDSGIEVWRDNRVRVEYAVVERGSSDLLDDPRELQWSEGQTDFLVVHAEQTLGLAPFLHQLREAEAAPAPSMLVQVHVEELSVVTITETGLRQQRFELWPGKEWQLCWTSDAAWSLDEIGPAGARAVCSIDPVRATAELGNTSFLVEVVAGDREGVVLFAPVSADRTFGGEVAFRTMADHFGVHAPVGIPAGTSTTLPPSATPASATLVESRVVPAFLIADTDEADDGLPAADEHALIAAGWYTPPTGGATVPVLALAVGRGLAALFDARGLRRCRSRLIPRWTVTDTWSGHGTTTRASTIAGDAAVRVPELDDGSAASTDFGVCSNGHLHAADDEWLCPACERWLCRACGDSGALEPCDECGSPACGDCRSQMRAAIDSASCAVCDRRSCGKCRRAMTLAPCAACQRDRCSDCEAGDLCITCTTLHPATLDDLRHLPVDLRLTTETVLAGHDRTARIIAIAGAERQEFLVAEHDGIYEWRCSPDVSSQRLLARRLAVRFDATLDAKLRLIEEHDDFLPPPDTVTLFDDRVMATVRWGGWVDVLTAQCDRQDIDAVVDRALDVLDDASTVEPVPAPDARWAAIRPLLPLQDQPATELRIDITYRREMTWIGSTGITSRDEHGEITVAPWVVEAPRASVHGTLLATSSNSDVSARLLRANDAIVIETVRACDGAKELFVVGIDAGDYALNLALENAFAARVAISTVGPIEPAEPTPADPTHARLIERFVRPTLVPAEPAAAARRVTVDDLALLGIEPVGAPTPRALAVTMSLPEELVDAFAPRVFLEQGWLVDEEWQGHGRATVRYEVRGGDASRAVAHQGPFEFDDFGVCRDGHLHAPAEGAQCDACQEWCCPRDGDDGVIDLCPHCEQPACGRCRSTDDEVAAAACGICWRAACGGCNRTLTLQHCEVCDREACTRCLEDGRCATCATLTAADDDDPRVPSWLHAHGLALRIASDEYTTIIALRGRVRRELVVLRSGQPVTWLSHPANDPALDDLALRLAVLARESEMAVEFRVDMDEEPGDAAVFLRHDTVSHVRWAITKGADVLLATSGPGAAINDSAIATVRNSLPAVELVPTPCAPERWPGIEAVLPPPPARACAVATITTASRSRFAALTNRGLEGNEPGCEGRAPWRLATVPQWVLPGLIASDTPAMCATLAGYSASIVRVGSLVLLGLRAGDDNPTVLRLTGLSEDLRIARLTHELGLPAGMVHVQSLVLSSALTMPDVANAELVDRQITYRAVSAGDARGDQTRTTVQLLLPAFDQPALASAGADVLRSLEDVIAQLPRAVVHRVAVVPQITDTWATKNHRGAVTYDLAAGEHAAVVRDFVTNEPLTHAQIDRSGHFVADAKPCPYCREVSCAVCEIAVGECAVCAQAICSNCVERLSVPHSATPLLCPACSTLSPEHHGGGVLRVLTGVHLAGLDTQHQVKVAKGRHGVWTVEGRTTPVAGAGAIAYLDRVASARNGSSQPSDDLSRLTRT